MVQTEVFVGHCGRGKGETILRRCTKRVSSARQALQSTWNEDHNGHVAHCLSLLGICYACPRYNGEIEKNGGKWVGMHSPTLTATAAGAVHTPH